MICAEIKLLIKASVILAQTFKYDSGITKVDLSYNNIQYKGILALADALIINKSLTTIKLEYNKITDQGIEFLSRSLKNNSTLRVLELGFNLDLTSKGGKLLLTMLQHNKTLWLLGLNGTLCDHSIQEEIKKQLQNNRQSLTNHLESDEKEKLKQLGI